MIAAVVFSRDRACQLDLLLRSLQQNGPGVFDPIFVIWRATDALFETAYRGCAGNHQEAEFIRENGLTYQTRHCVTASGRLVSLFTDDDVLYRPLDRNALYEHALNREDVFCFSFRLGCNTIYCYPHDRKQQLPKLRWDGSEFMLWEWERADQDFGYPGSIDGTVFRRNDLAALLQGKNFSSPNFLEETLMRSPANLRRPLMAAYAESHVVSIPANIVNSSHPNRHGEKHPMDAGELNRRYLDGQRIDLAAMDFSGVRGAHHELPYVFTS